MQKSGQRIVGIIPAAGKGTRLAPFPCPKELFPVGYQDFDVRGQIQKRPKVISQYLIEHIIQAGADRLFVILGDDKHDIMRYYGDGSRFGVPIGYLYQEKLFGLPHAINLVTPWLDGSTVVFGMPDTIIEPADAFNRLLAFHHDQRCDLTLGLFPTSTPQKFGMVDSDADGNVLEIIDKPASSTLTHMWGSACWSPEFTRLLDDFVKANPVPDRETLLGDVFMLAARAKMRVKGLRFDDGQYIDIGTADELDSALKKFHL